VTNNESQTETADLDAPIVFVGYGIKAPEYDWDDYKTVDLHGKVALLFVNEPGSDDADFFKGKAMTYYGRWTYKFEETARRGAVATLIIHRTDLASYGWEVVRNSWGTERSYLKRDETPKLQAASWIQLEVARRLVELVGLDLDKMFQRAQMKDFKPLQLPIRLKAHVASKLRPFCLEKTCWRCCRARPRTWQRSRALHGALRPLGDRSESAGRQDLQWRERQRHRLRDFAGARARLGWSPRFRHDRFYSLP